MEIQGAHRPSRPSLQRLDLHGADQVGAALQRGAFAPENLVPCPLLGEECRARHARRRESPAVPRPHRYTHGVLAKYAALVSSASEGAVTRPFPKKEPA